MPDILLRLRALKSDVPEPVRLRRALKVLLRCFQLRCISLTDAPTT